MTTRVRIVSDRTPQVLARIRGAVAGAVKETAAAVETGAKERAPVKSGFLRDHIQADTSETDAALRAFVISWAYYSIFQELGTRNHAAQPFLLPALEAARGFYLNALRAALRSL